MRTPQEAADTAMTISEAARFAGRSYTWAWTRARTGCFERCGGIPGKAAVTFQSVLTEIRREQAAKAFRSASRGKHLRLVIDNAK